MDLQNNDHISLKEFEKFSVNYDSLSIHVIGLNNFMHKKEEGDTYYYSIRADYYPIKILDNKGRQIRTFSIWVNSKYFPLKNEDRNYIIRDLELFDKNLATDNNININLQKSERIRYAKNKIGINIFNVMALLSEYHNIFMFFHEVIKHPSCFMDKYYYRTKRLKRIDNISIKLSRINPGNKIYSFKKYVNYDTEENRWIKKTAIDIMQLSRKSIHYLKRMGYYKSQPYYWNNIITKLKNIQSYLNFFY